MRKAVVLLVAFAFLAACGPKNVRAPVIGPLTTEQFARGVREELGVFIKQAQKNHPECSANRPTATQGVCPALQKAIAVNNRIIDAVNLYCSGSPLLVDDPATPWDETRHYQAGGPCAPVLGAKPTIQGVLGEALLILAGGQL